MTLAQALAWAVLGEFISDRIQGPAPRFPIDCQVRCTWIDEFGQSWADSGRVVGIFPAPENWLAGWWYVVRFNRLSAPNRLSFPHDDECHERELELME